MKELPNIKYNIKVNRKQVTKPLVERRYPRKMTSGNMSTYNYNPDYEMRRFQSYHPTAGKNSNKKPEGFPSNYYELGENFYIRKPTSNISNRSFISNEVFRKALGENINIHDLNKVEMKRLNRLLDGQNHFLHERNEMRFKPNDYVDKKKIEEGIKSFIKTFNLQ